MIFKQILFKNVIIVVKHFENRKTKTENLETINY